MRPLAAALLAALPLAAPAASSDNYALEARPASIAGASASTLYEVQSLNGNVIQGVRPASESYAVRTGLRPDARFDRPAASLAAHPPLAIVGRPLTLRAAISTAAALAGTVRFTEDGQAVPGCAAVPIQSPADGGALRVATCRIDTAKIGSHRYAAQFSAPADGVPAEIALDVASTGAIGTDYTDLWWGGMPQNGWGVSIAQHGAMQFNVIYTYDAAGKPLWYVMPGGTWDAMTSTFTGPLYTPSSSPFDAYVASRLQAGSAVGSASIRFTGSNNAVLEYTIDGIRGTHNLERQLFAAEDAGARLQVGDMWWAGDSQNGWGINLAQQGRMIFATWFTYDSRGVDTWFVMSSGSWSGRAFTGDLYATTSSPWLGASYSPSALVPEKVGSLTLDFADANWATMTYSVRGVTQAKTLVRMAY